MILILTDNKKASGKTTIAKDFLKDKKYLELPNVSALISRFCNFDIIPEWVLIDGATEKDLRIIKELNTRENLTFDVQYSEEKVTMKVPNFLLITNSRLEISIKD